MSKSIVITLIGDDRPGIVESISRIIVEHGGEWVESRMANLSGKFTGLLRVNLPDDGCEAFADDLKSKTAGLQIMVEQVEQEKPIEGKGYRIDLIGQDRPGIVHTIAAALAANGATVDDMETEVMEASMSGEELFKATFSIRLGAEADADQLRQVLEQLANELIVDIELE